MIKPPVVSSSGERGAILVHVAFVLVAVMALSTLVFDFGVLWVGRNQVQNAADAAALAGSITVAYDNPSWAINEAAVRESAYAVSQSNLVWGQPPKVEPASDITIGVCEEGVNTCVRVDAFRNKERGNPLPMIFGKLIGLDTQNVRATATAMIQPANATGCLKPWGIPDRWIENNPVAGEWTQDSEFNAYDRDGNLLPNPDVYIAPTVNAPGSGFTVETDFGRQLTLKTSTDPIAGGFYNALQLTGPGGDNYRQNISTCANVTFRIGDRIPIEPGNMIGPTTQGVEDLVALDPGATWIGGSSPIANSCVDTGGCPGLAVSPRIVVVPVYDVNEYAAEGATSGRHTAVHVRNILGFFIERMNGNDVVGYIVTGPGIYDPGNNTVPPGSSFLRTVTMVR